ncbi:hypothetical protein EDD94_8044 [Streptomyces sp. PanSC9]|nr:hypothetical protein EDD94_8044 [Streptomyces sp. PanSC9]
MPPPGPGPRRLIHGSPGRCGDYLGEPIYRAGKQIGDPTGRITGEAISDVVEKSMAAIGMAGR